MSSAINILPRVPIDVLVEPLLAQIQLVGCEVYDFELLSNIIIHPRLSKRGASLIANALGRYSLGHPIYWVRSKIEKLRSQCFDQPSP